MSSISAKIPEDWKRRSHEWAGPIEVQAAGQLTRVDLTTQHLDEVYLPLLALLQARADALLADHHRLIAGLVGIPGAGKSVFAAVLGHIADRLLSHGHLTVVGMDGWHYSNEVLDQRTTVDSAGRTIPLRERKGGPYSFDVSALVHALKVLRDVNQSPSLPVYDRRRHDPIPDAQVVPGHSRVILIEGNYLLGGDPPWHVVRRHLDVTFYLECASEHARERVIARHIRGGASEAQARDKYQDNDATNVAMVQATAGSADHILRF